MFNLPISPLPVPGMGLTAPIGVPVGTVVAFAGQIASSHSDSPSDYTTKIEQLGWILCDGTLLEVSKYPELFAVLGYLYGGKNDQFKIPDYRGLFLRGVDSEAKNDPDASSRTLPDGTKGDGVGSRQDDALQTHEHKYTNVTQTVVIQGDKGPANVAAPPTDILNSEPTDSLASAPGNVRNSTETRPKNVYVYYIIKYTNC